MNIRRIGLMVLLAAGIAMPLAYAQLSSVVQGADLVLTAFTSPEELGVSAPQR
jgi:ACR3 family arsenite efflux pump ArsB